MGRVVHWLDRSFAHPELSQAETGIYLTRLLGRLIDGGKFTLEQLTSHRYRLAKAVAEKIKALRSAASQKVCDDLLFGTLRTQWRSEAGAYLEEVRKAINDANGIAKEHQPRSSQEALDRAQAEVFERHSTIDERILLREALIAGRADVQLAELRKEVEARVRRGDLIRRDNQLVSRETLRMEREYLNWVLTYKRGHSDLGKVSNLEPELTPEQRQAVCTILFNAIK
jgi:hypothetical protein